MFIYPQFLAILADAASIFPLPPQPVRIEAYTPHGNWKETSVTLKGASNCNILVTEAERCLRIPQCSAFLYSQERSIDRGGKEHRGVRCFDSKKKCDIWIDVEDRSEFESGVFCSMLRVLFPSLPLPPVLHLSRHLAPRIIIETGADILCVSESRALEAAPPGALSDPTYVAFVRGLRSGRRFFWESQGVFIESVSGKVYFRKDFRGELSFIVALMRANQPVLRCKTGSETLCIWKRTGLELGLHDTCVRSTGRPAPLEIDTWELLDDFHAFVKKFTRACRK